MVLESFYWVVGTNANQKCHSLHNIVLVICWFSKFQLNSGGQVSINGHIIWEKKDKQKDVQWIEYFELYLGWGFPNFIFFQYLSSYAKKSAITRKGLHSLFKCVLNTAVKSDWSGLSCVGVFFSLAAKQNYVHPSGIFFKKRKKLISVCSKRGTFELLTTHIQRGNQIWWAADETAVGVSFAASSSSCAGAVAASSKAAASLVLSQLKGSWLVKKSWIFKDRQKNAFLITVGKMHKGDLRLETWATELLMKVNYEPKMKVVL